MILNSTKKMFVLLVKLFAINIFLCTRKFTIGSISLPTISDELLQNSKPKLSMKFLPILRKMAIGSKKRLNSFLALGWINFQLIGSLKGHVRNRAAVMRTQGEINVTNVVVCLQLLTSLTPGMSLLDSQILRQYFWVPIATGYRPDKKFLLLICSDGNRLPTRQKKLSIGYRANFDPCRPVATPGLKTMSKDMAYYRKCPKNFGFLCYR